MSSRNPPKRRKLKTGAELTAQQLELRYPPTSSLYCLQNSLGVWSKGNDDFKISHGITCTSCYFPESVSYWAMGRLILSLHCILLVGPQHKYNSLGHSHSHTSDLNCTLILHGLLVIIRYCVQCIHCYPNTTIIRIHDYQ